MAVKSPSRFQDGSLRDKGRGVGDEGKGGKREGVRGVRGSERMRGEGGWRRGMSG